MQQMCYKGSYRVGLWAHTFWSQSHIVHPIYTLKWAAHLKLDFGKP